MSVMRATLLNGVFLSKAEAAYVRPCFLSTVFGGFKFKCANEPVDTLGFSKTGVYSSVSLVWCRFWHRLALMIGYVQ